MQSARHTLPTPVAESCAGLGLGGELRQEVPVPSPTWAGVVDSGPGAGESQLCCVSNPRPGPGVLKLHTA